MSALATRQGAAPAYAVREDFNSPLPARRWALTGPAGVVDRYRSIETAQSYCRALNAGRAEVCAHAVIGCHVRVLGYVR